MGAEVLNGAFGILFGICAKLNICASNLPTSASPKPLAVMLRPAPQTTRPSLFFSTIFKKAKKNLYNIVVYTIFVATKKIKHYEKIRICFSSS